MRRSGPGAVASTIRSSHWRGYGQPAVGSTSRWIWNCSMSWVRISWLLWSPGHSDTRNRGSMVIADRGCLPDRISGYRSSRLALLTGSADVHALDSGTGCLRQLPYPGWRACGSRLGPGYTHAAQDLARSVGADHASHLYEYFDLGDMSGHTSNGSAPPSVVSTNPTSKAPIQVRALARKAPLLRSGVMLHWSASRHNS